MSKHILKKGTSPSAEGSLCTTAACGSISLDRQVYCHGPIVLMMVDGDRGLNWMFRQVIGTRSLLVTHQHYYLCLDDPIPLYLRGTRIHKQATCIHRSAQNFDPPSSFYRRVSSSPSRRFYRQTEVVILAKCLGIACLYNIEELSITISSMVRPSRSDTCYYSQVRLKESLLYFSPRQLLSLCSFSPSFESAVS